jgi:hypothetical protein
MNGGNLVEILTAKIFLTTDRQQIATWAPPRAPFRDPFGLIMRDGRVKSASSFPFSRTI